MRVPAHKLCLAGKVRSTKQRKEHPWQRAAAYGAPRQERLDPGEHVQTKVQDAPVHGEAAVRSCQPDGALPNAAPRTELTWGPTYALPATFDT